jgi:hypothetical protein
MTDHDNGRALTPDDPAFAAAVIEATRALIAQVAAWALAGSSSVNAGAISDLASITAPLTASPPPLPK